MRIVLGLVTAIVVATTACGGDGVSGDETDAGATVDGPIGPDANVGVNPCDMTGKWIAEGHTVSTALSADQNTTTWYYFDFTQTGDHFTSTTTLNCGLVVDGTTTVTLDDATLEALAAQEAASQTRGGTFKLAADGQHCEYTLDRMYNLRGASKATYLAGWKPGDPDKALSTFPALPAAPPGMEDWDKDNMDGITLRSALGNRYVAQRDYNQHAGTVSTFAAAFGGPGAIVIKWDSQEGISTQTSPLLRVTATAKGDGWARYSRADNLVVVTTGAHPALDTCKNVRDLASQVWH